MKLVIILSGLLLVAGVAYLLWPWLADVDQHSVTPVNPGIACDRPDYDFGEVATGTSVKTSFVLRNEGSKPVEIIEVRTGCGCTVATLPSKIIPPGLSISMDASLSLKNARGKQRYRIFVTSNDPGKPQLELSFQGSAVSEYELRPPVAHFNAVLEGDQASMVVYLVAAKPQASWKITSIVPSKPEHLSVRAEPFKDNGYGLFITLIGPQRGWVQESVRILTDSATEPEVTLPVYAQVIGRLIIYPDKVYLKAGQQQAVYWLTVRPGHVQQFKIKRVEAPAASIQSEIIPVKDKGYSIKLSNISAEPELHGKNLKIGTDVAGMEEILVPFHVAAQAGGGK